MIKLLLGLLLALTTTSIAADEFKNSKITHMSSEGRLESVLAWLKQLRNKDGRLGFVNEFGKRRDGRRQNELYSTHYLNTQDFRKWTIADLRKTKIIDLSGLLIDTNKLVLLSCLKNLEELRLSSIPLESDDLLHLKGISSLRVLKLAFCGITDKGIKHLKSHHNLVKLDIRSSVLTNDCIGDLRQLRNLKEVDFGVSKVNIFGARRLHRTLSDCVIKPFQYKLVKDITGVLTPVVIKGRGQRWKIRDTFIVGISDAYKKFEWQEVAVKGEFVLRECYTCNYHSGAAGHQENIFKVASLSALSIDSSAGQQPLNNLAKGGIASSPDRWDWDGESTSDQDAIDGDSRTYWDEVDGRKLYILKVKLKESKKITRITISGYNHHFFSPKDFDIVVDGKVIKTIKDAQYKNNFFETVFPTIDGRVISLKITGYYGGSPAIRELGIYAE
jgi:hypothetical protein